MQKFNNIEYKGGHPELPEPCTLTVEIDDFDKCIRLIKNDWRDSKPRYIDYDEIINIALDEKNKRSLGKAAVGAVVGGILTGGIGIVAGGLLGGRKKDTSSLYITIAPKGREVNVILKAGKNAERMYAAIASLMSL